MKRMFIILGVIIISGTAIGGLTLLASHSAKSKEQIIATDGMQWHSHLTITINGKDQEIPEGVGLTPEEKPIHTHDASGTIHLEFPGKVTNDDIRLKEFFKIWGKMFDKQCIFDSCNGPGGTVKFLVNGEPNQDFENYVMHDGDKMEIRYEK